ncbi:IclR family transcriptional regulator [Azospirillum sp.]|uniref:IclR family transcriptional regulator n=1 Tax=Azospirillum sp. TaxID=34012 RepID=UPI0026242C7A|nr:IclR family transcriptional regulator [Azospirillum sp.]
MAKNVEESDDDVGKQGAYTVQALDNAISLLMLVAENPDLGLSDLSRKLGAGKARVYRQLKTLEDRGLVTCSEPHRTYRLGYAALLLGAKASAQIDLVQSAKPFLTRLGEALQETTQLRVLDGGESVCVANWVPDRDLRVQTPIGSRTPLHAGSGKILLAYMPQAEQVRILSLPRKRFTGSTMVDEETLTSTLLQIRRDGYGVSRGEMEAALISAAAPIFGPGGRIVGVLVVGAPATRMDDDRLQQTLRLVCAAAQELTAVIGGNPPSSGMRSGSV